MGRAGSGTFSTRTASSLTSSPERRWETPALAAYELNNWFGLFAPAGVLPAIVQVIHGAAVKALSSRELQQRLIEQGGIPMEG